MTSRPRIDPLRALLGLEAVAVGITYVLDLVFMFVAPVVRNQPNAFLIYSGSYGIAALFVFLIPHRPNRRFVIIAAAALAIMAVGALPNESLGGIALLTILAARLTFAFGFRGSAIAWLTSCLTTAAVTAATMRHHVAPTAVVWAGSVADIMLMTLIIGMIGIVWLYSEKSARGAASAQRAQIALDLHDALGHTLTALAVQLQTALRLRALDAKKADAYVARAAVTTEHVLADVRATVALLHEDSTPQSTPLPLLIEKIREEFEATHDLEMFWRARFAREPAGRTAMTVYRVLQEALTNVVRHARATRVDVEIATRGVDVCVMVRDDGTGFEEEAVAHGHGLASMRSRVESAGGTLTISSRTGAGTCVEARLPLEAAT